MHVLNRAAGRIRLLNSDADFLAFERLLVEAHARHPIAIYSYCLMGNHWHLVVHPERDGQVTAFFKWLTHAHAMRWRTAKKTVGHGPLYRNCLPCHTNFARRAFLLWMIFCMGHGWPRAQTV